MMNMKLSPIFQAITVGAALMLAGAGCRHTPVNTTVVPGSGRQVIRPGMPNPNQDMGGGTRVRGGGGDNSGVNMNPIPPGPVPLGSGHEGWNANTEALAAQTIHFDYDKSAIRASEESKLNAVADYLRAHPTHAVRVDGNCDERGTEEYNRSLGERRALSGREYLIRQGIDPTRVDTETYGKDKPVANGHDESAWSQNRRDEFVVLTPPGQ